jgi:hypothetical protein
MTLESVNSEKKQKLNFTLSIQKTRMVISDDVENVVNVLQDFLNSPPCKAVTFITQEKNKQEGKTYCLKTR